MKKQLLLLVVLACVAFSAGAQWSPAVCTATSDLRNVQMLSTTTGYMVGLNGLFATTNGGQSWTSLSPNPGTYYDLHYFNSTTAVLVGYSSQANCAMVTRTTNGITWSAVYFNLSSMHLYDVHFVSATTGFAVGDHGLIIKTTNGGAAWSVVASGTTEMLSTVEFDPADSTIGIIRAESMLLRTTDGGNTWIPSANVVQAVDFAAPGVAYMTKGANNFYKSTDGGATWQSVTSNIKSVVDLYFLSVDTGYASGHGVFKTTDGGQTWVQQKLPAVGMFVYFFDNQLGFYGGTDGLIYRTANAGGASWLPVANLVLQGQYACSDSTFQYTTACMPGNTYAWYFNNQLFSTTCSGTGLVATAGGASEYALIVTNSAGSDTAKLALTTYGSPVFNFPPLRANKDSVCSGQFSTIYCDSALAGTTYQLYKNGVAQGSQVYYTGGALSFSTGYLSATATFSVTATRGNPCATISFTQSKVIVVADPEPFTATPVIPAICSGDTLQVTIQPTQAGYNYSLISGPYTLVSGVGTGDSITLSAPNIISAFTYGAKATNYLGCQRVYTSAGSFTVRHLTVGFTSNQFVQAGQDITLVNNSNADFYNWTFGNGANPATATTTQLSPVTYNSNGNSTVTLYGTTVEGCSDSSKHEVTVYVPLDTVNTSQICWFDTLVNLGPDYEVLAYHVDRFGNHYVAGYDYYSGMGSNYAGSFHYYLQKFNTQGQLLWTKTTNPFDYDNHGGQLNFYAAYITGITTDPIGNVYVCGNYTGKGFVLDTLYASHTLAYMNFFVAKLDSNGHGKWLVHSQNTNAANVLTSASDVLYVDDDHIYVSMVGDLNNWQYVTANGVLTQAPLGNTGVLRFNQAGTYLDQIPYQSIFQSTIKVIGFYNAATHNGMVMPQWFAGVAPKFNRLPNGRVMMVGNFGDTLNFGGHGVHGIGRSGFAATFDMAAGWVDAFFTHGATGQAVNENFPVTAVDADGSLYVSRWTSAANTSGAFASLYLPNGTIVNDSTGGNWLMKYSSTGQFKWIATLGKGKVRGLAVDENSNKVYVYGHYQPFAAVQGVGQQVVGRPTRGSRDAYLMAFDSSGHFLWHESVGGDTLDGALVMRKSCNGVLNCLGYTYGNASIKTVPLKGAGLRRFLLKYDPSNHNCNTTPCPAAIVTNSAIADTIHIPFSYTVEEHELRVDTVIVTGSAFSTDTVFTTMVTMQGFIYHVYSTQHYPMVQQVYDPLTYLYVTQYVDSAVVTDSVYSETLITYIDSMYIILTVPDFVPVSDTLYSYSWQQQNDTFSLQQHTIIKDSTTVLGTINKVDTVWSSFITLQQYITTSLDTTHYFYSYQQYDTPALILYTHYVDSAVYWQRDSIHQVYLYFDTMHIIRTITADTISDTASLITTQFLIDSVYVPFYGFYQDSTTVFTNFDALDTLYTQDTIIAFAGTSNSVDTVHHIYLSAQLLDSVNFIQYNHYVDSVFYLTHVNHIYNQYFIDSVHIIRYIDTTSSTINDTSFVFSFQSVLDSAFTPHFYYYQDSTTIFTNFNALDTLYTQDTVIVLVGSTNNIDTIHHIYLSSQSLDSVLFTQYNHYVDSVVYLTHANYIYNQYFIDSVHIIRYIDTASSTINDTTFVFSFQSVLDSAITPHFYYYQDSTTIFTNFNALDTLHTRDTVLVFVNAASLVDTVQHVYLNGQQFDNVNFVWHNHYVDSVIYLIHTTNNYKQYVTDSAHIIRNIDTINVSIDGVSLPEACATLFPNPAGSNCYLILKQLPTCNADILLFNAYGQLVHVIFTGWLDGGERKFAISTSTLAAGTYWVTVRSTNLALTRKVVVQH